MATRNRSISAHCVRNFQYKCACISWHINTWSNPPSSCIAAHKCHCALSKAVQVVIKWNALRIQFWMTKCLCCDSSFYGENRHVSSIWWQPFFHSSLTQQRYLLNQVHLPASLPCALCILNYYRSGRFQGKHGQCVSWFANTAFPTLLPSPQQTEDYTTTMTEGHRFSLTMIIKDLPWTDSHK